MQVQAAKRTYTPEEYLELEETAEYKNEYRDGEIIPMTGGTTNHNTIAMNLVAFLKFALRQQDYYIYANDVRLWIARPRCYVYPDVMIIQGEPSYEGEGKTTVTNPLVVIEVLSKSTKNYDQVDKFDFYRSLPSFKEYILVDQYQYYIKQFAKNADGKWVLSEYQAATDVLALSSLDFQINLSDIYHRVNFETSEV